LTEITYSLLANIIFDICLQVMDDKYAGTSAELLSHMTEQIQVFIYCY